VSDRGRSARLREPGGGLPLGRFFGIPIYLSPSWLLFAAFITLSYAPLVRRTSGVEGTGAYLAAFAFAVLLAASVLLHELGHCAVSRALGLPVRRVTLFLLGGVSEITAEPEDAGREYLVAMAGPLVSLVLSVAGFLLTAALPDAGLVYQLALQVAVSNALVAVFNLLPGLPLDGGRLLRAGVWQVTRDRAKGTAAAGWVGRVIAGLVLLLPLSVVLGGREPSVGSVLLAGLLAAFIWAGATQALRSAAMSRRLPDLIAGRFARPATAVSAQLPLAEALRQARAGSARALVVTDSSGRPVGLVSEAAVVATPEQRQPWVTVGTLSRALTPELVLDADLRGEALLDRMRSASASEFLVVDGSGAPLGVLLAADVAGALGTGREPARTR